MKNGFLGTSGVRFFVNTQQDGTYVNVIAFRF